MGNGIRKLQFCFAGDGGDFSRRHHDISVHFSDPLDEGLGHSFYYIRPDSSYKTIHSDDSSVTTKQTAFPTISGASISANTYTALSTDLSLYNTSLDKAAAFESSNLFSSIPLQPIPRNSVSSVRSGPIPRISNPVLGSGPIERGFLSGPIERGFLSGPMERCFISGPLENQFDQLQSYRLKPKKWALIRKFRKAISKSFWGPKDLNWPGKVHETATAAGSPSGSNNLSCQTSLNDDSFGEGNDSFGSQNNVQWAQGKAGEDRVHIVISEEHGWVFVGIYDGFNGPDATGYLLNNLYTNVYNELKGILWNDVVTKVTGCTTNHIHVIKALSEALRKTEAAYLNITDLMVMENPELSLMGSCVLVMLMKGDDIYVMNVGDSRAILAKTPESDQLIGKNKKDLERIKEERYYNDPESDRFSCLNHLLSSYQLTSDHTTCVKEEVMRIRSEHPDDVLAISNERVKGSLKVTRAFGAGFLKQAKWNEALLEMFRIEYIGTMPYISCLPSLYHHRLDPKDRFLILSSDGLYQYLTNQEAVNEVDTFMTTFPEGDPAQHLVEEVLFRAAKKAGMDFHELLDIPQGDRRKYHDDVSIIIISFEGRIWRSSV